MQANEQSKPLLAEPWLLKYSDLTCLISPLHEIAAHWLVLLNKYKVVPPIEHACKAIASLIFWKLSDGLGRSSMASDGHRIEDTDLARSTRESEEALIRELKWLGIHWDEGTFQAQHVAHPPW